MQLHTQSPLVTHALTVKAGRAVLREIKWALNPQPWPRTNNVSAGAFLTTIELFSISSPAADLLRPDEGGHKK